MDATRRRWINACLQLAAVGLLVAAIWAATSHVDWPSLAKIPPRQWVMLALAVALNLLLAGAMFWSVTLSFDARPRVGLGRMTLLIVASALLNFLPLRPGLLGRAAILKAHHQLPLRQSLLILLVVLVTGGVVTLAVGLLAWLIHDPLWLTGGLLAAAACLAGLAGPVASKLLGRPMKLAWLWVVIRVADALVAGWRLWLAMGILGLEVNYRQALAIGAAGLLVAMIGLTPNGLGIKEWLTAWLMQALAATPWEQALAASLIDRGIEALVVIPAGLAAIILLRQLWRPPGSFPWKFRGKLPGETSGGNFRGGDRG